MKKKLLISWIAAVLILSVGILAGAEIQELTGSEII